MLILSRVCAEFRNRAGESLFVVTPRMLNTFQEAPEGIREDPLFALLTGEGSLEAVVSDPRRKALENDPLKDTDRSGKRIPAAPTEAVGAAPAPDASSDAGSDAGSRADSDAEPNAGMEPADASRRGSRSKK